MRYSIHYYTHTNTVHRQCTHTVHTTVHAYTPEYVYTAHILTMYTHCLTCLQYTLQYCRTVHTTVLSFSTHYSTCIHTRVRVYSTHTHNVYTLPCMYTVHTTVHAYSTHYNTVVQYRYSRPSDIHTPAHHISGAML